MTKNKWTTEQENFLKLHYAEGKGLSYCTESLGLCRACHRSIHFAKRGELRGTLTTTGEGNPQPSRSNVLNFVERKVQRLTGEDAQSDKPDTSAPHLQTEMMR